MAPMPITLALYSLATMQISLLRQHGARRHFEYYYFFIWRKIKQPFYNMADERHF
jgi:hypothetical protein